MPYFRNNGNVTKRVKDPFFYKLPQVSLVRPQSMAEDVVYLTTVQLAVGYNGHDGVIKWKHFPRYWPFVRGIHRSPLNSPHKGQWRGALMFSLICARINGRVNSREADDLRRHRTHYDVIVMVTPMLHLATDSEQRYHRTLWGVYEWKCVLTYIDRSAVYFPFYQYQLFYYCRSQP